MQRASRKLLVVVSLLLPTLVFADDARTAARDVAVAYESTLVTLSSRPYWRDTGYALPSEFAQSFETAAYPRDSLQPFANLDFRDAGTFSRVSKVRELSVLTLAEVGRARLFFGVSDKGLFGFHLGARPGLGDERCVELARMPYLKTETRNDF